MISYLWKWKSFSCVQLCNPMDYTVHGILQARILMWVAIPFSRGSSQSRDRTQVFSLLGNTQKSHLKKFQSKMPSFKRWKILFYFKITMDIYIYIMWHISEIVDILVLLLTSVNFDVKEIKTTLSGSIALVNSISKSQLYFFCFQNFAINFCD